MAETIEGINSAIKGLKAMAKQARPRVVRSALNAALNPGLKAARAAAPVGTKVHKTHKGRTVTPGFLSRNIKKSTKTSRDKTRVFGNIRATGEAFYGSFSEFGTKHIGKDPFFFSSIESVSNSMERDYFKKMNDRIIKEFRKK